jgi:hypothetical protein
VTLEGTVSIATDPEGPFGEDSFFPNQIRWSRLDYDGEFGVRGSVGFRTSSTSRVEARGAYLGSWDDTSRQTGVFGFSPATPAPPMVPGLIPGVSAVNSGTLESEADAWTAELNFWQQIGCTPCMRTDVMAGLRVMSWNETATADGWATAFVPGFPGAPFVRSDVDNLFLGFQVGAMTTFDVTRCFSVSVSGKGMLGNINRQSEVSDRAIFAGGTHSSSLEEDEIVLGFELELGMQWRLTDWISVTGGYSGLFLDGVQRAHDVMNFGASTSGAVQTQSDTDQLLIHSLFLGVRVDF